MYNNRIHTITFGGCSGSINVIGCGAVNPLKNCKEIDAVCNFYRRTPCSGVSVNTKPKKYNGEGLFGLNEIRKR